MFDTTPKGSDEPVASPPAAERDPTSESVLLRAEVARLKTEIARLQQLAATDELTKLWNHRAFEEHLAREFARAERSGTPLSLIVLDVDHFKSFNDRFGHLAGDEALAQLAQVLTQSARTGDVTARWGGEEFAILLPDTAASGAIALARRVQEGLAAVTWPHARLTASLGIATTPMSDAHDLFEAADLALYRSKVLGRNRTTHFAEIRPPRRHGDRRAS